MRPYNVIVFLDLDRFKDVVANLGWKKYRKNIITSCLTDMIIDLASKHSCSILYGLNRKEGTEECMLLFSMPDFDQLLKDLDNIRQKIEKLGKTTKSNATISIGIAKGIYLDHKPIISKKKQFLLSDPLRKLAKNALKEAKKKGGNKIIIK
ncbi:MAG: hypothetical protein ACTSWR_09040 [Candidatus Helarchaeota archaeon]